MKSITLKNIETGMKLKINAVIEPCIEFTADFEPVIIQKRKWIFDDTGEDVPFEMQEQLIKPKLFEPIGKNQIICKIE